MSLQNKIFSFIFIILVSWSIYIYFEINEVKKDLNKCENKKPTVDTLIQFVLPYEVKDAP